MHTVNSTFRFAVSSLAFFLLIALGACSSSSSDLMEQVPASAQTVIVNNLTQLMDDAGYTTAPRTMPKWITAGTDILGNANEAAKALDVSNIVTFSLGGGNFTSVVEVRNESALASLAENVGMTRADAGGYTVWKGAEVDIAVKNHLAWIAPDAVTMAQLAETKCKSDGNYTLWKGLVQFLNSSSPLGMVVCVEEAGPAQTGKNLCMEVHGNDEAASIEYCMMEADGEKIKNDALTTIHTDFLRYLPRNFNAVMAMGVSPSFDWNKVGNLVESFGGGQARGSFDAFFNILRQCDGTVAIAADGYSLPSASPAVIAMVHMPQEKVDSTVREAISQFTSMGLTAQLRPDGQTEIAVPGMRIFIGSVDGYFAIGTQPFVADNSNSLTTTFQGQLAAASVQLETLRTYNLGLNYGLDLSAKVGEYNTDVRLRFPGSTERPLANLISLMAIFL